MAHARPGVTRAEAARLLGVGTGAATEIVARLSQACLLAEAPAAPSGIRGRPTTVLVPHPAGPLVLAAAITHEAWRIDVVELGGNTLSSVAGHHSEQRSAQAAAQVTAAIDGLRIRYGERLRALGLSVPGTVSPGHRLDASGLSWHDVDLTTIWPAAEARWVFVAGNDATLAASAESSRGAATGAAVALHLRIEGGLGGAVVDHGRVLVGARGAGGEFGHMPFGDPAVPCGCGASGLLGHGRGRDRAGPPARPPQPRDPVTYARRVIAATTGPERAAVRTVAAALGRGMAGLVNGLDADLVTLGGLGADLLAAAPAEIEAAYRAGLDVVPPSRTTAGPPGGLGADGPSAGAGEEAWSRLLTQLT